MQISGVPLCTCQLAQVCRRSCHRKSVIPARSRPAYQALVLTWMMGLPRKLNTCVGVLPDLFADERARFRVERDRNRFPSLCLIGMNPRQPPRLRRVQAPSEAATPQFNPLSRRP